MSSFFTRHLVRMLIAMLCLSACKKEAPKPKREDVIAASSRERRKITSFANALRKVLEWRHQQPLSNTEPARQAMVKAIVEKLTPIPASDLPRDMRQAWKRMLKAWQNLAAATTPSPALAEEGRAAAEELNRQLAANGYPDVRM